MNAISRSLTSLLITASLLATSENCPAREWSDASGRYQWEGELLGADTEIAIIREQRGRLHGVHLRELSKDDRAAVKEWLRKAVNNTDADLQTWTMRSGLVVKSTVLGYKSGTILIESRSGAPFVNRQRLAKIDPIYLAMLPQVVAETEDKSVTTLDDFKLWVRKLRSEKKELQVDGVLMQLESGEEYAVPLFMFSKEDAEILGNGWKQWQAAEATAKHQQQQDLMIRAEAAEHQRRRNQETAERRQIEMMKLGLLAVDAGITSLWEIRMVPSQGNYGRPLNVIVPGKNSAIAGNLAAQKHPGYTAVGARQISRR